jgi:quercetin dioxygenase-like cupin family protein
VNGVFIDWEEHRVPAPVAGVAAYQFSTERVTCALFELGPGVSVPEHAHEGDEVGVVLTGEIEVSAGGESRAVHEGESFLIPRGMPHAARTMRAACRLFECYAPRR